MKQQPTTEKQLVKYNGTFWLLDSISSNGMAKIWTNGQPAIVHESLLEYYKG